jgi:hypothetical protein
MEILCIFPVTNNEANIPKILEYAKKEMFPQLKTLGAARVQIKFPGTDYVYAATNETVTGTPKGKGIVGVLKNVDVAPNIVLVCDGSGKIPYDQIIKLFRELISDQSVACVMGDRTSNLAISYPRYLIERFEIFVLRTYLGCNKNVSDGQCGLWGFRYGKLSINGSEYEIKLTAEGYEIEIDLLSEVLEQKLNYSFIEVMLPHSSELPSTAFTYSDNITKMKFIIRKYPDMRDKLLSYLKQFEHTEEYLKLINKKDSVEVWNKYGRDLEKLSTS